MGKSYLFTFKLAIVTTVVVNVLSLDSGAGAEQQDTGKELFPRAHISFPTFLGALVVGYIFNYFFTYILPAVAGMMGEWIPPVSLSNPSAAWIGIMVVCAWQAIAMNTIIYISGLQTVPEDVYEAGGLDGSDRMEAVQVSDVPADHSVLFHQHGALREELPDGIRPDHGFDKGRPGTEYGIHLLPDL